MAHLRPRRPSSFSSSTILPFRSAKYSCVLSFLAPAGWNPILYGWPVDRLCQLYPTPLLGPAPGVAVPDDVRLMAGLGPVPPKDCARTCWLCRCRLEVDEDVRALGLRCEGPWGCAERPASEVEMERGMVGVEPAEEAELEAEAEVVGTEVKVAG